MSLSNLTRHEAFRYDVRLKRVADFVAEHFAEVIRLEDAAAAAGLETTYFSKYFHHHVGICFRDWLAWYRIRQACEAMRQQKLSIAMVADMCGFGDARTFERTTLKLLKCTPRELRDSLCPPQYVSDKTKSASGLRWWSP